MGMSASQARYIALTARMNDTEYEAQQINQQRLTLSNKMNEVYEALVNMDVPTPPSKQDFITYGYSGKTNGGKKYVVSTDHNGNFKFSSVRNGQTVKYYGNFTKGEKITKNFASVPETKLQPEGRTSKKTCSATENVEQYKQMICDAMCIEEFKEGWEFEESEDGKFRLVNAEGDTVKLADGEDIPESFPFDYPDEEAYSDAQFNAFLSSNYYVKDGNGVRKLNEEDFDRTTGALLVDTANIVEESEAGEPMTIDVDTDTYSGCKLMSIEDAKNNKSIDQDGLANLLIGLKHTYPNAKDGEYQILFNESSGDLYVCKTSDVNNGDDTVSAECYAEGEYLVEEADVDPKTVKLDINGNPASVTINGDEVVLTVSKDVNETDFQIATAKYESDKIIYDKEQNRLNKQTSIYQRQDKQLELKLTRLDSERNALNTELEAVKKVIQDAIDKGFKTFSG